MAILGGNAALRSARRRPRPSPLPARARPCRPPTYSVQRRCADTRGLPELGRRQRRRDDQDDHRRGRQDLHAVRRLVQQERRRRPSGHPGPDPVRASSPRSRARSPTPGMSDRPAARRLQAITTINSASFGAPLAGPASRVGRHRRQLRQRQLRL